MNTIELRQRKKMVIPFIAVCLLLILLTAYGIFFTDKYKDDTTKKIGFIAGLLIFLYFTYLPLKKLVKNQAIIVFNEEGIVLNTKKTVVIPKRDIDHLEVVYV